MKNGIEIKKEWDGPMPLLFWIRAFAWASGLAAIAGLFAISAIAQPKPPGNNGFEPGARTFTNPFANTQADPLADEDSDDFIADDFQAPQPGGIAGGNPAGNTRPLPRPGNAQPGISIGGQPDPNDVPNPRKTPGGIAVGGDLGGGVVSTNEVAALQVDSITGVGSKEIITDFNYPDVDVLDLAKTIGKLTGKNFIFDKNVKGRISVVSNSPITVADAWRAFLTALDINGFTLIPSGKYIRLARQRDARDKQLNTFVGDYSPDTDALITRVFPLRYISSEEVARTFRSFMPANSRIIPYDQTNTVIVTDTGANISKLAKMLEFLDVEGYDAGIEVITVKFASAAELSKLIDTLLPGTTAAANKPGQPRTARATNFQARRTKEGGIVNNIIADERTNTLIVHANSKGVEQVRELITKLDKKMPAPTGGGKIHVVYLQFASSEEIAKTLNNLSQQAQQDKTQPTGAAGKGGVGTNPVQASLFEGSIRVSADKATNSLVITASPQDFVTVQRVINKLDIPRDEVYVEAVIMELSLGSNYTFSTNVALPTSGIGILPNNTDFVNFLQSPISQKGLILGFKDGQETEITVAGQKVKVAGVMGLIKALQTNARANVLATPQILTLDNTEATFETKEKIPVPSAVATQGAVASTITKEDVTLSINIKPQINKISNFVKLDIKTKLADISSRELPAAVANQAFATFERNAETSVVVADTDTVVLGGLVRDKQTESVSKIPILGDIPLLGWLFKSKQSAYEKTNLLIFITPHIVRQYDKVRAILDKKLKERDDFIERSAGGEDPMRHYRDDMIRTLPGVSELLANKPQQSFTLENENPAARAVKESGSPFTGDGSEDQSAKSLTPPPAPTPPESAQVPAPEPTPSTDTGTN